MRISWRSPSRALVVDGVLAIALAAFGVAASSKAAWWQPDARLLDAGGYQMIVWAAAPLVVRRSWPFLTLMLTSTITFAYLIAGYPYGPIFFSLVVAVYTAALRLPGRRARIGAAAVLLLTLVHAVVQAAELGAPALIGFVPGSAWVIVPFAVGRVIRVGRESTARTREEQAQRSAYEERLRIAQEVHDVVGHGLAAINMQAEIALHVLPKRPEQAETALTAISRTSKQALDDLRATLVVVRRPDGPPEPRAPGLGLDRLHDLVTRMSGTGVAVTVRRHGTSRELPATVDLAAYRIVQEALTNVLRHAGAVTAEVGIRYEPEELTIEVNDDGRSTVGGSDGHGITGMRERVTALGGVFKAGPRPGGGFGVHARLPLREAAE